MNHQTRPRRTPVNPANEALMRWVSGTGRGQALGHWLSRTIALRDINLVFPLQRLRELEAAGAIGRVAERHYGFGLVGQAAELVAPGQEVGRLLKRDQVDLALFVPA